MRAVLGIDAAWTERQPSGVALAVEVAGRWHLAASSASYGRFLTRAADPGLTDPRPIGSVPDAATLIDAARHAAGCPVDLVAIDMPLARSPIAGRRAADDAVSRAYGGRKCSTHSPSAARPGPISDRLRADFARAGYALCTGTIAVPGLIEVYPHPALLELAGASERLPYKTARTRIYWKEATPAGRRAKLLAQWRQITAMLDGRIAGVAAAVPLPDAAASGIDFKACEDVIDAIVCAWVAIAALDGAAIPYGDPDAAIWIPRAAMPPPA